MNKKTLCIISVLFISAILSGCCLKHQWADATCTQPKTCEKCGETQGEALSHTWGEATCTAPKTCSVCNATEGEPLEHSWIPATCTEASHCVVCKTTTGEAKGHIWTDATCDRAKTCLSCHAEEGTPLGHNWAEATCAAPKTCKRCSATEGTALTLEEYLLSDESHAEPLLTAVRAAISTYPDIYEDYEIFVEGNTLEYVYYYKDSFANVIDTLREQMAQLDWQALIGAESIGFKSLYGVAPERIIITYAVGDQIIFSSSEFGL